MNDDFLGKAGNPEIGSTALSSVMYRHVLQLALGWGAAEQNLTSTSAWLLDSKRTMVQIFPANKQTIHSYCERARYRVLHVEQRCFSLQRMPAFRPSFVFGRDEQATAAEACQAAGPG